MIEPGPTGDYGACGIGRAGMDATYSAALWRDNPTAFWLHPEGPLADSTPGEFFVARCENDFRHDLRIGLGLTETQRKFMDCQYLGVGLTAGRAVTYEASNFVGPQYARQYALAMQNSSYADYANAMQDIHNRYAGTRGLFGGLL